MTLSPELEKILLVALSICVILLLFMKIVARLRRRGFRKTKVAPAPKPLARDVTPEEWAADFDRTVSELLGIDPGKSAPRDRAGSPSSTGVRSWNGSRAPLGNGHGPVHGHGLPIQSGRRAAVAASRLPFDAAPMTAVESYGNDATLHLLPGRLEAISGFNGREVRFVYRDGLPRYTFGRSPGPPFEHVQILAPTVSRMHAFMEYVNGQWRIGNLSASNAVRVNGTPVVGENTMALRDGDHVEMGEVVFVFRER